MYAALFTLAFLFFSAALRVGYYVPWGDHQRVSHEQLVEFALFAIAGIAALGLGAIVHRLDGRQRR